MIREVRAFDEMTDLVAAAEAMDKLYSVHKEWRDRANPLLLGPEREAVWIVEIEDEQEGDK